MKPLRQPVRGNKKAAVQPVVITTENVCILRFHFYERNFAYFILENYSKSFRTNNTKETRRKRTPIEAGHMLKYSEYMWCCLSVYFPSSVRSYWSWFVMFLFFCSMDYLQLFVLGGIAVCAIYLSK